MSSESAMSMPQGRAQELASRAPNRNPADTKVSRTTPRPNPIGKQSTAIVTKKASSNMPSSMAAILPRDCFLTDRLLCREHRTYGTMRHESARFNAPSLPDSSAQSKGRRPITDQSQAGPRNRRRQPTAGSPPVQGIAAAETITANPAQSWLRVDLHVHTPASTDYQQSGVSALDILHKSEERGLDVVAFTDHNSVRGYADLWREIEDLELLDYLNRMAPAEAERLAEYRRLLGKILLLPGFEFTATFGFHILAIFPETTSIRLMEHLLLTLGVSEDRFGSGEVGATSDVLRVYEVLAEHGAIVIGAHVNSTHGIAMQGIRFGGQTKIAYTQDPRLCALEVTDLDSNSRRSTAT